MFKDPFWDEAEKQGYLMFVRELTELFLKQFGYGIYAFMTPMELLALHRQYVGQNEAFQVFARRVLRTIK